jgi:integrase
VGSVYPRKNKLWLRHKGPDGKWTQSNTPYQVGQERLAKKLLDRVEAKIAAGAEFAEEVEGPLTVKRFAERWIADRERMGLADWENDKGRLALHVLPTIGHLKLEEVRMRHLADVIRKVRLAGKAPRTVRNIYSAMSAMFRDARIGDLIDQTPAILNKYQLGQVEDAKPEWRVTAIYTRAELEQIIADERLTHDQRVWYALQGLAGLRPGEAAPLRWSHYDTDLKPLGRLLIANSNKRLRTKTGAVRQVPVHATLAKMLGEWKLSGWPALMGRHPGPEDLMMPSPAARRVVLGTMRNNNTWSHQTRRDLATLGLRHRRGYDLRRTFISLARTDGARADLLKLVTHGSDSQRNMMDL